jgi:peptidyl-prolyl cis-trans isomerase SurA
LLILHGLLGGWGLGIALLKLRKTLTGTFAALAFCVSPLVLVAYGEPPEIQRSALASPAPASTPPAAPTAGQTSDAVAPTATVPAEVAKPHDENGIVAIVNDRPISEYDLRQRMSLVMTTSNIPRTPEMEKRVRQQVLEQLETEMLQRTEALKNDITVSSVEVDKNIQAILTENKMTLDQLKEILARGHVALATLRAQISAQILWQKAVQEHFAGRVNISPEMVDAELGRIAEGANRTHYIVSEIFLPVDNPELDEKVQKDAQGLETQLQAGANFGAVARQFSQSPSAAAGGDIGQVYDGQLAPELNKTLEAMKTGDISQPIRSIGGYYILALRQRLEAVGTKIVETTPTPDSLPSSLNLSRILLPLGPKPAKEFADNAMKAAEQIRDHIGSCEIAQKIAQQIKGALYFPLGTVKLADLNQQARTALGKTEPGDTAEPFLSDAGVELFVRCDKAVPKLLAFVMPTRDQVEQQLFEEQISALARRYNRDLKRNADIETR